MIEARRGDPDGTSDDHRGLIRRDHWVVARPTRRIPLVVERGDGVVLADIDGRTLVDLTSGWNVANTGWNHPTVVSAVAAQLGVNAFAPPWCSHSGRVGYAERLCDWLDGDDWLAWSGVSGSEAVETALKIARRATGRHAVVGFRHAYHGGTLGAMLAGGVPGLHGIDLPDETYHRHAPIPDPVRGHDRDYGALARKAICADPHPAAVLLEPLFTNPGAIYGDDGFYRAVSEAVDATGALLIVDEIGTGFGRTGRRFAFEHFPLRPDIVAIGKAMASGVVPMSATLIRRSLADAVAGPGFSSTFGWTPLACAAAMATLDVIEDEQLLARADHLGKEARRMLQSAVADCNHVAMVRGKGLELGIEVVTADRRPVPWSTMNRLCSRLLSRGVFAEPSAHTSTLLIMPPLVIDEGQLESALTIVADEVIRLQATLDDPIRNDEHYGGVNGAHVRRA